MQIVSRIKALFLHKYGDLLECISRIGIISFRNGLFNLGCGLLKHFSNCCAYSILSHSEYIKTHSTSTEIILKDKRVGYAASVLVFGEKETQQVIERPLPPIMLYSHRDTCIVHGSDHVICPEKSFLLNDYCASNNNTNNGYGDSVTLYYKRRVAILKKNNTKRELECGIRINGKYSFNYYHNMYENLIRLLVIIDNNCVIPQNVPLLIDEDIMNIQSLKSIYEILTKDLNRETIVVKKGERVLVHTLYSISDINYLVPQHNTVKGEIEDYVFDKYYTLKLRDNLLNKRSDRVFPKRFFITRKSTDHRHFNEDELFSLLEPYGFVMVRPELLTIEEQIALFHSAEWIVGGSGAAFTNVLFCTSACNLVCLYRNVTYISNEFSAPAYFNNAYLLYLQSRNGLTSTKAHTDFSIDKKDFTLFVQQYIRPKIIL